MLTIILPLLFIMRLMLNNDHNGFIFYLFTYFVFMLWRENCFENVTKGVQTYSLAIIWQWIPASFWHSPPFEGGIEALSLARRGIFSKSYEIKQKSDCIYHAPIDLKHKRTCGFVFQINQWKKLTNSGSRNHYR